MTTDESKASSGADVHFFPRFFVIAPTVATLVLAAVAWTAPLSDAQRIQAVWTLAGIVVGLALAILYRHFEVYRALGDTKRLLDSSIAASNMVVKLNQRMAKIESSLMSEDQYGRLCEVNDAMGAIAGARLKLTMFSDLIRWKEERIFSHWHSELSSLSGGVIEIDDARKELNTNEIFLRTIPKRFVKAVSFEDEEFWRSPEGAAFLEAHSEVVRTKGLKIVRIFIIDGDESKYRETFEQQKAHGIEVRYLSRSQTSDLAPEDFVIYDDDAVRIGFRPHETENKHAKLINKFAKVTIRKDEVDQYNETFQFLLTRSHTPSGNPVEPSANGAAAHGARL